MDFQPQQVWNRPLDETLSSATFRSWTCRVSFPLRISLKNQKIREAKIEEIHRRFGDFDLFMPDSGQYNINWHYWHMFPEESVMAAETLGAKTVMPIHWGAFVLSGHGWDDSPERVTLDCEEKGIQVISPKLCETMVLDKCENYHERWWREYN